MIQALLFLAITALVVGGWGCVTFQKPLNRLISLGVAGGSAYLFLFAVLESL